MVKFKKHKKFACAFILTLSLVSSLNNNIFSKEYLKSNVNKGADSFVSKITKETLVEINEIQETEKNAKKLIAKSKHIVHRVKTDKKVVALTFDDGPDPRFTPKLLDILNKYNAKATFFVVGKNALEYPDIIKRTLSDGDEVENHTFTHPEMKQISDKDAMDEAIKDEDALWNNFGVAAAFFRPPKGDCSINLIDSLIKNEGMRTILWSICFEHKAQPDPYKRAQEIIKKVKPGYIILAHDGRLDRTKTVEGMEYVIKGLKEKGYKFVTLNELIGKNI